MKNKWLRRILITIVAIALVWFVAPLFFNKKVDESREAIIGQSSMPASSDSPAAPAAEQEAPASEPKGTFVGVTGHQGSGTASLITTPDDTFIRLEDDFSVTSGPDLYVYVGNATEKTREIARLKGNQGGQNYKLPEDVELKSFDTVWIYCKAFSVSFAKAELKT